MAVRALARLQTTVKQKFREFIMSSRFFLVACQMYLYVLVYSETSTSSTRSQPSKFKKKAQNQPIAHHFPIPSSGGCDRANVLGLRSMNGPWNCPRLVKSLVHGDPQQMKFEWWNRVEQSHHWVWVNFITTEPCSPEALES